jgi:hypothetical protein
MIAGQRHDLPGVTFSTVEEIYRRGQGTKVPGLMQLQGEPGRVAKLVQIYDTAPDYGEHHDLSIESIHNVTSLFVPLPSSPIRSLLTVLPYSASSATSATSPNPYSTSVSGVSTLPPASTRKTR